VFGPAFLVPGFGTRRNGPWLPWPRPVLRSQEHPLTPAHPQPRRRLELPVPARLVVLVSGSGTLLQALLDAGNAYPAHVVAVGADRDGIEGLRRAELAGVPTFVVKLADHPDRASWDAALTSVVAGYRPDLVVLAGFMKLLGAAFLGRFGGRVINSHPALLPAFPGAHAVRDALAYGAKVTGCSIILVDDGVDTGPVLAQQPVSVEPADDEHTLHERIKAVERRLLVDVVAALARHGATITGREVSIP
jgi:formyltetrahydrofolate-dependent phosphoribosylglycinamide formyltransferase